MKATVPVFVTGVTFPRKKPGSIDRAFVEMQDDADCHPFKVAFDTKDARALQEAMENNEGDDGEPAQAQITVTYPSEDPEHQPIARAEDGGKTLRPHTITGWWQVWSGTTCVALVRPEEMEPVRIDERERILKWLRAGARYDSPSALADAIEHQEHVRGEYMR